jgi:hypothetical protein
MEQFEDIMTAVDAIAQAQPADRDKFLKSIHNTPMEDKLKAVFKAFEDTKKSPEAPAAVVPTEVPAEITQ